MNEFDEKEFLEICNRFNAKPCIEEVTIKYSQCSFFNKMKKSVEKDRRGEVVFGVIRPSGKVIAVTCAEYPEGVFRIPTGGIAHNENIAEAVFRETKEELGLEVKVTDFGGVIKIRFEYEDDSVMFYSYLFILEEIGGRLLLDATDDEVSEIKEVGLDGLESMANSLRDITSSWSDWGQFRYVTTNAIFRSLKTLNKQ